MVVFWRFELSAFTNKFLVVTTNAKGKGYIKLHCTWRLL